MSNRCIFFASAEMLVFGETHSTPLCIIFSTFMGDLFAYGLMFPFSG